MKRYIVIAAVLFGLVLADSAFGKTHVVDFAGTAVPIKRLNGMCNTVPIRLNAVKELDQRIRKCFQALEIPETRFHDSVIGSNSGVDLVDVSRIFPLFHLDENDPRNYNFGPTDEYIASARECGGVIEFRFGEQIETERTPRRINPPPDIDKWARICLNIARHYNSGWANGHHWKISRFSVWEEPDNDRLLAGSSCGNYEKCYLPMYAAVVRLIKAEWPDVHVGGPNTMGVCPKLDAFLAYCKDNALPLDFCSVTSYGRSPEALFAVIRELRATLDRYGFDKAETEISEWHYRTGFHFANPDTFDSYVRDLTGLESAAYTAAVLTGAQETPADHMFFYAANVNFWGLFEPLCHRPRPVYHALRDFATTVHNAMRVPCPLSPTKGWYVLATRSEQKRGQLLLSALGAKESLRLAVKGAAVRSGTAVAEKGEPVAFNGFSFADGILCVPAPKQGAVYRLAFDLTGKQSHE